MWTTATSASSHSSPSEQTSFAPRGFLTRNPKFHKKTPRLLNLETNLAKGAVAQIHNTCSVQSQSPYGVSVIADPESQSAIHSRLGWTKNAHFLEQFRYIIVASQLLNDSSNSRVYQRQEVPPITNTFSAQWETNRHIVPSSRGLLITGATAFSLAWSVRWLNGRLCSSYRTSWNTLLISLALALSVVIYYYSRRQRLHNLRVQAVNNATNLTTNAQNFDAAATAGTTLIQEVELVSRGYSM